MGDPTPERRMRAVAAFVRVGRQAPQCCFRVGDIILQHSCSEGYGPWKCRVADLRYGCPRLQRPKWGEDECGDMIVEILLYAFEWEAVWFPGAGRGPEWLLSPPGRSILHAALLSAWKRVRSY